MGNQVTFRRVHGRVIPIHDKGNKAEGAALVGSGLGVGAAAGAYAAHLEKKATEANAFAAGFRTQARSYSQKAKRHDLFSHVFKKDAAELMRKSLRSRADSVGLIRGAKKVKYAGLAAATALLSTGVYKLLPKKLKKKHDKTAKVISATTPLVGAFAVRSGYYKYFMHPKKGSTLAAVKLAATRVAARGIKL